jgi:hypothetical protein
VGSGNNSPLLYYSVCLFGVLKGFVVGMCVFISNKVVLALPFYGGVAMPLCYIE